jgi:formylglycine-generating enzyme required for sulfatase activity
MRTRIVWPAALLIIYVTTCRSMVGVTPPPVTPTATPTRIPVTPSPTLSPTPSPSPTPPVEVITWPKDEAEMVLIPAGSFTLGLDAPPTWHAQLEAPPHSITLPDYWIDRYEVTNERFGLFVAAGGYTTRQYWTAIGWQLVRNRQITAPPYWDRPDFGLPQQPVVGVTWYEAYAFCLWAEKRLPSEAEWEKAARGADERLFPWGDEWDCTRGNFDDESLISPTANECDGADGHTLTAPVGSYQDGMSPYYVYDMAGNAWEWTLSKLFPYPYLPSDGRNQAEDDAPRVIRGGSWFTYTGPPGGDNRARTTYRGSMSPASQDNSVGFRCVAEHRP